MGAPKGLGGILSNRDGDAALARGADAGTAVVWFVWLLAVAVDCWWIALLLAERVRCGL